MCLLLELTSSTASQSSSQLWENPGDRPGILAHLAVSVFAGTMHETGLPLPPARVDMRTAPVGCPPLSINVYWTSVGHKPRRTIGDSLGDSKGRSRNVDKTWTTALPAVPVDTT
jgi:hypothetical protein